MINVLFKTKNQGFTPILVLLVLGIVVVVAYLILKPQTPSLYPSPTPTQTPDPTDNWKTYTNTKHSYQVRYLSDWEVGRISSLTGNLETADTINFRKLSDKPPATSGISIIVIDNPENLTASQICRTRTETNPEPQGLLCSDDIKYENVIVNNLKWEKLGENQVSFPPSGWIVYSLAKDDKLFIIYNWVANESAIDQILSTFKFIDQKVVFQGIVTSEAEAYVVGQNNKSPVPNFEVMIFEKSTEKLIYTTRTDKNGKFTAEITPGSYYITYKLCPNFPDQKLFFEVTQEVDTHEYVVHFGPC